MGSYRKIFLLDRRCLWENFFVYTFDGMNSGWMHLKKQQTGSSAPEAVEYLIKYVNLLPAAVIFLSVSNFPQETSDRKMADVRRCGAAKP